MMLNEARLYRYALGRAQDRLSHLRRRRKDLILQLREMEPSISAKPPIETNVVDKATGDTIAVAMPHGSGTSDPTGKAAVSIATIDEHIKGIDREITEVVKFILDVITQASLVMSIDDLATFYQAHCLFMRVESDSLYRANDQFQTLEGLPKIPKEFMPDKPRKERNNEREVSTPT